MPNNLDYISLAQEQWAAHRNEVDLLIPITHVGDVIDSSLALSVGGFDAKFARTASEDFEFTLRCVAEAPIGMIEDSLTGVRRHGGNFSGNQLKNLLGEVKILRHAQAHQVHISATFNETRLIIEVSDDGIGFDSDAVIAQDGHYGLLGLRERARLAGGYFEIVSTPGKGTVLRLCVPAQAARMEANSLH